jgi:RNA polymerase sigma-70 factor (ECF subfamily)
MINACKLMEPKAKRMTEKNRETESARQDPWGMLMSRVSEARDKQAFEQLFDHFAPLIKGYLLSLPSTYFTANMAEELTQEVMLSIWRKAHLYDATKASAATWVFTIARNLRVDAIRKHSKHQNDVCADDVWYEEVDPAQEPIRSLQRMTTEKTIRESLSILPIEQKQVLSKVFMEDKSHQAVADELGLPLGTVKSRVRLALQKLRINLTHLDL